MFGMKQPGPCKGDRVQVETLGTVVDFEERAGVNGALVQGVGKVALSGR